MNERLIQNPAAADLRPLLHRHNTDWLAQRQAEALDEYQGLPSRRIEDWKYTDVGPIAAALPTWLEGNPAASTDVPEQLQVDNAVRITLVNGRYRPEADAALPDGIIAGSLDTLAQEHGERLQARLGALASNTDSGFVALNTAFTRDAVFVSVEPGKTLDRPVCISVVTTVSELAVQPRIIIDLAPNSRATVIEHYVSSAHALVNAVTEISCADGSELHYYKLQDEHRATWHTAVQYASVARDAVLRTTQLDVGGGLVRNDLRVMLNAEGAHADATGLFMADERRHVESRITVNHLAPNTTSEERFRGILGDQARGVFNGRIFVDQSAQKTSAELSNRNLLLSKGAEINTKPELEIYADDVKCAHGATTGQLDKNSLFYLLSRGVDPSEARNMLITAFAGELLTGIEIPALAERAQQALSQLGGRGQTGEDAS